jgi:putative transposase
MAKYRIGKDQSAGRPAISQPTGCWTSPWENGYIESFNARLRDELLNGEIFYTLREAQIVIESWRRHYNTIRPHASIGYKPPAPEVFVPAFAAGPAALRRAAPPATLAQPPTLN